MFCGPRFRTALDRHDGYTGRTVFTPVLAIVETSYVDFPSDPGLVAVALRFGVAPDALLGHGGEAWVYALDDERVLRVLRDGGDKADVLRRMALVEELALAQPAYRLPEVLDVGEIEGRTYAIERRLPGRSMLEELGRIEGAARERLIEAYLDTSASLGDLHLPAQHRIRRAHRRRLDRRFDMARVPRGACGQESVEVDARAPASRPCRHCRRASRRVHPLVRPPGRVRRQLSH